MGNCPRAGGSPTMRRPPADYVDRVPFSYVPYPSTFQSDCDCIMVRARQELEDQLREKRPRNSEPKGSPLSLRLVYRAFRLASFYPRSAVFSHLLQTMNFVAAEDSAHSSALWRCPPLYGPLGSLASPKNPPEEKRAALTMNDLKKIYTAPGQLATASYLDSLHTIDLQWLESQLRDCHARGQQVIVATHHAPMIFRESRAAPQNDCAYGSDLTYLMRQWGPAEGTGTLRAWFHGHTHVSGHTMVAGVYVASNQTGNPIPASERRSRFEPELSIPFPLPSPEELQRIRVDALSIPPPAATPPPSPVPPLAPSPAPAAPAPTATPQPPSPTTPPPTTPKAVWTPRLTREPYWDMAEWLMRLILLPAARHAPLTYSDIDLFWGLSSLVYGTYRLLSPSSFWNYSPPPSRRDDFW
ncbi:hypothetical protein PAPYR_12962 [Paratrimastix pyriformis]|uniref:Calcineurin-like phosphoesterase domain-containing protein n=1 Tax=Paratrimastix pyriformis TaxID=342808 RepID=A0ABQ8U123_9EUKA|nr:hypothetical protein PAPYR_12962 [Paratrimastix pyriformis]